MKRALVVVICWFAIPASRAEAWNPFKAAADKIVAAGRAIGGALGAPAGGFIESATTPVIRSTEDAGHRLIADADREIEHAGGLISLAGTTASTTIAQADRSLAARILQVQTGVDHTIDHAFDRIDLTFGRLEIDAQQLLERAERLGGDLIKQIDGTVSKNLTKIDQLLATRVHDVDLLVSSSIQRADDVARERLAQLDELAGRRLGNLDVIATKQSLSLEGMLVRIAALVGMVGLIAFVAWRVFRELADALALAASDRRSRLAAVGRRSLTRLVPQLLLASGGALVLSFLANYLPRDSERRASDQIAQHATAFEAAVRSLDVLEARYHESQLEILAPADLPGFRARLKKTELLHSLFTRPGQLHTPQGLAGLVSEVAEVEAAVGTADPDVLIAKAYVLWQVGGTRDDEYESATLCADALRRGGGLLAPLARNYVRAFLIDPYAPREGAPARLDELARLAGPVPADQTTPFSRVIEFDQLVEELDRASTAAYLDMLSAHADLRVALARSHGAESAAVRTARDARTAAANRVIEAWAAFDRSLQTSPALASDTMALSVFTLDDTVLTHARYYTVVIRSNDLAPALTGAPGGSPLAPATRARIAPLRVAWEQRYAALLGPAERDLVAYQETARFAAFERRAAAFEAAYVEFLVAARAGHPDGLQALAATAATRAAGMGLYRTAPAGRITEASNILEIARDHGQQLSSDVLAAIAQSYQVRRLRLL